MDIDIAQLASQIAPVLIPYLVKGGEAFAGETGKKMAESLWGKFKPKDIRWLQGFRVVVSPFF